MADWTGILLGVLALGLGGVLKGATGIGAPVLAVPLLSALYGVQTGIVLFAIPNLLINGLQGWSFRADLAPGRLVWPMSLAGLAGTGVGIWVLVNVSSDALLFFMGIAVLSYVGFRLARPAWSLSLRWGCRLAVPVGLAAGAMFGAVGISAPVSVSFLSALKLGRETFVATISVFFFALALVQIPLLLATGVMTPMLALGSLAAVVPIWLGMPVGGMLIRHASRETFDRITLALIGLIGVRMLWQSLV